MSKQFYENLLAKFKKANSGRKLKLAKDAGYNSAEEYMKFLEGNIASPNPDPQPKTDSQLQVTDMVIAFDTTGSMSSYINNVKTYVDTLIPKLFKDNPTLNISIVAFGDYCDIKPPITEQFDVMKSEFGPAYQVLDLTDDIETIQQFVLRAKNTMGGDGDEFYELVIKKITEQTSWRENSNKVVLLIGDAPPHHKYYDFYGFNPQIDWKEEARRAVDKGIIFDTLTCGSWKRGLEFFKELSTITGGVQLPFKSSAKTDKVIIATASARGGEASKAAFTVNSMSKEVLEDSELTAVYGMYKNIK